MVSVVVADWPEMNAMPAEVSVDIKDIVRLKKWFWAMTGHIK